MPSLTRQLCKHPGCGQISDGDRCDEHQKIELSSLLRPSVRKPVCMVTLVCGAPGAGKTTWVRSQASLSDVVIDLDEIKARISGVPVHQTPNDIELLRKALIDRNKQLTELWLKRPDQRVFFITGSPEARERRFWRRMLGCDVVVIDPGFHEVRERIRRDATRNGRRATMIRWAARWYREYTPDVEDTCLP